ncbi:MAG: MoaD/ThiS family protein [Deltaproteobacteria bacterium]|jgi:sulfur carrier protein ThiS|nr:MoaD/ThiS family protein [Deltaproteobacteria bacterium]
MQVQVKLYGTLGKWVAGYDHRTGLAVNVDDGATVTELMTQLGVPLDKIGMVSLNGRLVGKATALRNGALVKVFHPIFGG